MKRIAIAIAAALPLAALAETSTWKLDPAHSQTTFQVRHLAISNVRGEFGKMDGTLAFDPQDPSRSKVEVAIDTNTIDTRNEDRDKHLKSADFFDAQNHPKMTFKSTKIEGAGDGKFKVTGDLTIRGNTRPVTLDAETTKPIKDMKGEERMGVTATGKINRKDYGIQWSKMVEAGPVVGDEVKLDIGAEFVKQPGSPQGQAKAEAAATKKAPDAGATAADGDKAAGKKK